MKLKIDFFIFEINQFTSLKNNMEDLNEQIPRLRAYIRLLEKEEPTRKIKQELEFQKSRLDKMLKLVK